MVIRMNKETNQQKEKEFIRVRRVTSNTPAQKNVVNNISSPAKYPEQFGNFNKQRDQILENLKKVESIPKNA